MPFLFSKTFFMKKIIYVFSVLMLISSCQIKEEVTIHPDGSGEYKMGIDLSPMLNTLRSMKNDSITKVDMNTKPDKKIDSLIPVKVFYEKSKDSLKLTKKEKKVFKEMEDLVMHIQVDEGAGKMKMEYIYPFRKINQLDNFFQNLKLINQVEKRYKGKNGKKISDEDAINELSKYKVQYTFKNKVFKRTTQNAIVNDNKDNKEKKEGLDKLSEMFSYEMVYHFPYPIKKVNYKGEAKMSTDRKTLYITVPVDNLDKHSDLLNFEVILE